MAKYEKYGKGNFDLAVKHIHDAVMHGSATISHEEQTLKQMGDTKVAIYAYERYAYFGKNRTSLTITIIANLDDLFVCAIATGGSQAVFFKVNTWSEASFLETAVKAIDQVVK